MQLAAVDFNINNSLMSKMTEADHFKPASVSLLSQIFRSEVNRRFK